MQKKIFVFWEPKNKIPSYLQLCFETWKKFLPDYEIIILDYSNIEEYLSDDFIARNIKKFPLPKQADILKCMVLKNYGGIFLDIDTIITSSAVKQFLDNNTSDFTLFYPHICFIKAKKESLVLRRWEKRIKKRIEFYNKVMKSYHGSKLLLKFLNKKLYKKIRIWNYFGNGILDKFINRINEEEICLKLDRGKYRIMPELLNYDPDKNDLRENFTEFYFKNNYANFALNNNFGFLFLHNSWVKKKYRNMSREDFLNLDVTIANILKQILY